MCIPSYQNNTGFGKVTNVVYALARSQFLMAQQARSLRTDNESEERLRYPEENNVSSANVQRVVSIQFVDEGDVTEAFEDHREVQIDEYETDSDDEESELVNRACVTRSGRAVKPVKPREPLNNKCNKFFWTSWK